jgi:hypothetical protein
MSKSVVAKGSADNPAIGKTNRLDKSYLINAKELQKKHEKHII